MDEIRELKSVLKIDDKRRITNWRPKDDIEWLKRRKVIVEEHSGEECEILFHVNTQLQKKYALFFKHGYYQYNEKKFSTEFVKTSLNHNKLVEA